MLKPILSFSFSLSIALATVAQAADIRITLENAANYALQHNPSLAAARLRIEEAEGRLQQSGRLTNPMLEWAGSRQTAGREGSATISFSQQFPLTDRLRHEKAVTRALVAAAQSEIKDMERMLAADVGSLVVQLLALGAQSSLRVQQLENSRELYSFLLKRVSTGEIAAVDASQVELESQQIEIEALQIGTQEVVLLGKLRPLLGASRTDRIVYARQLPPLAGVPHSASETGNTRPDLMAAQHRAVAARSSLSEQRARRWDDVSVGLSYMRDQVVDEPSPIETEQIIGLRFSVPLPLWNRNEGRIREAAAAATRADKEIQATRLTVQSEIAAAQAAMKAYTDLIRTMDEKVLPSASQIEARLRTSYSSGQTSLPDVLRARTRRITLQQQRVDALRDYHLARIAYSAAAGSILSTLRSSSK